MKKYHRGAAGRTPSRSAQDAPGASCSTMSKDYATVGMHLPERRLSPRRLERRAPGYDGFSLLELVVAVSIMLILGVVGFVAYQSYTDNARQAAVQTSADEVLTAVIAADNTPHGDPIAAVEAFNDTSTDIVADIAVANTNNLTVRAMTCAGDMGTARTAGNYSHMETTDFQDVEYEWVGTPGRSASTMSVCGEVVQTNHAPLGTYANRAHGGWLSNNTDMIDHSLAYLDDHPQGIQTARETRFSAPGASNRRDFFSDFNIGGLNSSTKTDYFGVWVWSSVDARVELGSRTYEGEHLPANTWRFFISERGANPGVYVYMSHDGLRDMAEREKAVARVTGMIATNGIPPTEYFDGDSM